MNKEFTILALPQGRLLALIALWWGFWLCAARIAYPKFVDSVVVTLVLGAIACFVVAAALALTWFRNRAIIYAPSFDSNASSRHELWPIWGVLIVILYQLFLERHALQVLVSEGIAVYRTLVFTDANRVFGNWKWIWPYDNFLMPFGLYCLYRWLANGIIMKLWVVATIVFFMLDTLTHMGRFPLYMMLFCFGLACFVGQIKITFVKTLIAIAILLVLVWVGVVRGGGVGSFDELITHLQDAVINYHVYGFGILGHFVQGLDRFETPGIPFLSAGFLWSPIYLFEGWMIELGWVNYYGNFNAYIQHPFDLGVHFSPNAFTTILLPFWLDGGVAWLFLVMGAVGVLFGSTFAQKGTLQPSGLTFVILHVMIFGIFQPILNSQWFYVPLATHLFANTWIRYRNAKHQ